MFNIAYDKDTKQILGFIDTNEEINPEEVFSNFHNYEVIKTDKRPPIIDFDKHTINFENNEISFPILNKILSKLEEKQEQIRLLREELRNSNQTLLDFLEGEISVTDYAETKLKRQSIRKEMKKIEAELLTLKGENNG